MSELHLPWLELSVLVPAVGAAVVHRQQAADAARRWSIVFSGLALLLVSAGTLDFAVLDAWQAVGRWDLTAQLLGRSLLVVDGLSAPLLPLVGLLFLLTAVATPRTKVRRFSFSWTLLSEALTLATLGCKEPWGIAVLMALGTIPAYLELRSRQKPTGVYVSHMGVFVTSLVLGCALTGNQAQPAWWAVLPILLAVLVRSGLAPFHCWMTDLFEHATFGTALLVATPMLGAYLAARLILPTSPEWVITCMGGLSLATAVYAAGMALVQREARRFFCYLFLSHSALVLVGLDSVNAIGLTGALCVWLSVGLALGGLGLTLRAIEARHGRLSLRSYLGLYDNKPTLAVFFLLTGLASVGFPGTFGFIGTEMLVDGAVQAYPVIGATVVVAAALNGIAVLQAYFLLFTGARHPTQFSLSIRLRERVAVLLLAGLILGGGVMPQPGVLSRHRVAEQLLETRRLAMEAVPPNADAPAVARVTVLNPAAEAAEVR